MQLIFKMFFQEKKKNQNIIYKGKPSVLFFGPLKRELYSALLANTKIIDGCVFISCI